MAGGGVHLQNVRWLLEHDASGEDGVYVNSLFVFSGTVGQIFWLGGAIIKC